MKRKHIQLVYEMYISNDEEPFLLKQNIMKLVI